MYANVGQKCTSNSNELVQVDLRLEEKVTDPQDVIQVFLIEIPVSPIFDESCQGHRLQRAILPEQAL